MGRQFRTPRMGQTKASYTVTKASSLLATVPTGGTVVLSTANGTDYTLMPPEEGVETIIVATVVTTGALAVRACTKGAGTASFSSTAGDAVMIFDKAGLNAIRLLGLSSSRWAVSGFTPKSTAEVVITTTI
jgi:hypothetical protein